MPTITGIPPYQRGIKGVVLTWILDVGYSEFGTRKWELIEERNEKRWQLEKRAARDENRIRTPQVFNICRKKTSPRNIRSYRDRTNALDAGFEIMIF